MAIVTIGRPAYFFVLFVDEDQEPVPVVEATIQLFTFDDDAKVTLIDDVLSPTGDVGKFMYSYMLPEDWNFDSNLYAHMRGTDAKGERYLTEQHFDLWNADGTPYRKPPPPPPVSHWNTDDGSNGADGLVSHSELNFATAYIPESSGGAGNPIYSDSWATKVKNRVTRNETIVIKPTGFITGVGGDSQLSINVQTENNSIFSHTFDTQSNGFNLGGGVVSLDISDLQPDEQGRFKANLEVSLNIKELADILNLKGAKIRIVTTHVTDSVSDGAGSYSHTVPYFYYDRDIESPEVDNVIFEESVRVVRHLSGIAYYDRTSTFLVAVTGIDHLNDASAKSSQNLVIVANNIDLADLYQSPFGLGSQYFTAWTPKENVSNVSYQKDDWTLLEPNYRAIGVAISASAFASDTWSSSPSKTSPLKTVLIDTYTQTSNPQYEGFDDEVFRKQSDYTTAWDSEHHLNSGEALVQGGFLQIPHTDWSPYLPLDPMPNPDYTPIGQTASFYRVFDVTDNGTISHSNMTMTVEGLFVNGLEQDLINGDLQIFIRRKASLNGSSGTDSTPLSVHGTAYNNTLFDDGVTNSQIREFVVGNTISLTFGGYAVREGVYMEIRITNPLVKLESVLVSFLSG